MRLITFYVLLFSTSFCFPQHLDYSVLSLDKGLTDGANAVVRLDQMKIQILAVDHLSYEVNQIVTVLNKYADHHSDTNIFYDKEIKIQNVHIYVYNKFGEEIDHFKKKDFQDVSAVDGFSLFNDDRVLRHRYVPRDYPYTIRTTYNAVTSDTGFFPPWYFLSNYSTSVEKSHYEISYLKPNLQPEIKEHNLESIVFNKINDGSKFLYTAVNIPAISHEELSPSFRDIVPRLSVKMKNFSLKGEYGEADNWQDLGNWMNNNLLKGRDELSNETIAKANDLVKGVTDEIEKAKIIYKYVQNNTRYISVQIGIGGWKPISAIDVDLVKYGDCKGLSNYTQALLKAVGVTSYYTVIYAGVDKVDFQEDFTALQGNHAILAIPNKGSYYWIDCTSQVHPFGFVGDFTDDRKAMIVTPQGGEIVRTVSYINEDNSQESKADYRLDTSGGISGNVTIKTKGIQYDEHFKLERGTKEDILGHYKAYWENINNLKIENYSFENDRNTISFNENIVLSASNYASISGDRILFTLNAFNRNDFVPSRYSKRLLPFEIQRGFLDDDKFKVQLPKGYQVEAIPSDIIIDSKFGNYHATFKIDSLKETIFYEKKLLIKKGLYTNEEYDDYRNFRKDISKADNSKVVLIKK